MRRATLLLASLLMSLLSCSGARGQGCALSMTQHYSIYHSVTKSGSTIYTSVSTQGYASITPSAGCNMNGVTHKPEAYNLISNTGGWQYGTPQCASCYLSITNNQQFVGVPGVVYPFNWDGEIICSMAGPFYSGGGSGNIPGCVVPGAETTADNGFYGASYRERFDMTLSDTAQDSFDGYYDQEVTTSPGTNTCWWSGSRLPQNPGVQGSQWTVGTVAGVSEHNHWGYDSIGWDLSDLDYIVQNGPAHGVTFPCVTTLHQGMQIMCNANTYWQYHTDDITITVDKNPNSEEVCRDGVCGIPVPFAHRGGRQSTWWARILNPGDTFSVVTRTAKEGR